MISSGDKAARDAFRTNLREESTPLPLLTQELDASDILEVQDVAAAIARAEQLVEASRPRSSGDLFASLGLRPTDDAVGPAIPAPVRFDTPLPAPLPVVPTVVIPPAPPSEDAFYQPAGRIRTLADATLDGCRPESTLLVRLVRADDRRRRFARIALAAMLPLLVLTVAAFVAPQLGGAQAASLPAEAPPAAQAGKAVEPASEPAAEAPAIDELPVFDVNSLPSATK
jgi:hypothetical protein